jgi:hypothetical protein
MFSSFLAAFASSPVVNPTHSMSAVCENVDVLAFRIPSLGRYVMYSLTSRYLLRFKLCKEVDDIQRMRLGILLAVTAFRNSLCARHFKALLRGVDHRHFANIRFISDSKKLGKGEKCE